MSSDSTWLPGLVSLGSFGGSWERYLEALYACFKADFVDYKPLFEGKPLGLKRHPLEQGKEATFWHLISEGATEEERIPDMRRCERIRWPRPMIETVPNPSRLRVWNQIRKRESRIAIALDDFSYVVILAERRPATGTPYILPWTAYWVSGDWKRQRLEKEWRNCERRYPEKAGAVPEGTTP